MPRHETSRDHPEGHVTFAEMVPLFQELFDPNPAHTIALIGRVKHLMQIGALSERSCGRGRTAFYSPADVRRLVTIMALCDIGFMPVKAVEFFNQNEARLLAFDTATVQATPYVTVILNTGATRDVVRKHLPSFFYMEADR